MKRQIWYFVGVVVVMVVLILAIVSNVAAQSKKTVEADTTFVVKTGTLDQKIDWYKNHLQGVNVKVVETQNILKQWQDEATGTIAILSELTRLKMGADTLVIKSK